MIKKSFLILSLALSSISLFLPVVSSAEIFYEATGSAGTLKTTNGESETYNEVEVGAIYQQNSFLTFKGSAFTRFTKTSFYGVNLSSRFSIPFEAGDFLMQTYVGPGYRFMSRGFHAPFAEGGVMFAYPGIQFSLGYRLIMNEVTDKGLENDGQFFISFNGVLGRN